MKKLELLKQVLSENFDITGMDNNQLEKLSDIINKTKELNKQVGDIGSSSMAENETPITTDGGVDFYKEKSEELLGKMNYDQRDAFYIRYNYLINKGEYQRAYLVVMDELKRRKNTLRENLEKTKIYSIIAEQINPKISKYELERYIQQWG
jgi:hypothetical protein